MTQEEEEKIPRQEIARRQTPRICEIDLEARLPQHCEEASPDHQEEEIQAQEVLEDQEAPISQMHT